MATLDKLDKLDGSKPVPSALAIPDAQALSRALAADLEALQASSESGAARLAEAVARVDQLSGQLVMCVDQISVLSAQLVEREAGIEKLVAYIRERERLITSHYEQMALREQMTLREQIAESAAKLAEAAANPPSRVESSPRRSRASRVARLAYHAIVPHGIRIQLWERLHADELRAQWAAAAAQQAPEEAPVAAPVDAVAPPADSVAVVAASSAVRPNHVTKPFKPVTPRQAPAHLRHAKPRVAYLTNQLFDPLTGQPSFGGRQRYCATLGKLLQRHGFDVTMYQVSHVTIDAEAEYYGLPVKGLDSKERYSEFHYGACDAFTKLTRDYDHVIHNLPEYSSGAVRSDAVVICHGLWFDHDNYPGMTFRTDEWFEHFHRAFSQASAIVSVDTNTINFVRALYPDQVHRLVSIPNWVDIEQFTPPLERHPDSKIVLFPHRAQVNRGSRMVGDILRQIPHDWQFWWAGDGDEHEMGILRQAASRDSRLKLHSTAFEGMPQFYLQAPICVIPTVASEGTSPSCLEALACSCAVVTTNVGGLTDLVISGVNGLVTDPYPDQIARAINFLIENPHERARLQIAGPRTARYFSQEVWEQRWLDLLRKLGWME